jgi:hypothetical protein
MGGLARTIAVIDAAARVLESLHNLLASFGYKSGPTISPISQWAGLVFLNCVWCR